MKETVINGQDTNISIETLGQNNAKNIEKKK
jgi:hypothetical protein